MRIHNTVVAGLSVALLGLGALATAGSANAAGCLKAEQHGYSIGTTQSSDDTDAIYATNKGGYRCDTGAAVSSFQAQNNNKAVAAATAQTAKAK